MEKQSSGAMSAETKLCVNAEEAENAKTEAEQATTAAETAPVAEEDKKAARKKKAIFTGKYIAKVALFSALAGILYIIPGIPLGIFASWLELRFFDIPTIIGTFALGPIAGTIIVAVRIVLKIITVGTTTGYVGELGDLLCGLALVLPVGLIYRKKKSFKWAVISLVIGTVATVIVAVITNRYMLIPFYANLSYIGGMEGLVGMLSSLYSGITVDNFYAYYLGLSVVPFNLLRCAIAIGVTLPIYKRISNLLKRM